MLVSHFYFRRGAMLQLRMTLDWTPNLGRWASDDLFSSEETEIDLFISKMTKFSSKMFQFDFIAWDKKSMITCSWPYCKVSRKLNREFLTRTHTTIFQGRLWKLDFFLKDCLEQNLNCHVSRTAAYHGITSLVKAERGQFLGHQSARPRRIKGLRTCHGAKFELERYIRHPDFTHHT